eukprot:4941287-Pleurochrysis_carterae.AAC.1
MRRPIQVVWVWQARGIGFSADCARGRQCVTQAPRSVRCEVHELFEARTSAVKPAMHVVGRFVGSHDLNVRYCAGGVHGEGTRAGSARVAACHVPLK